MRSTQGNAGSDAPIGVKDPAAEGAAAHVTLQPHKSAPLFPAAPGPVSQPPPQPASPHAASPSDAAPLTWHQRPRPPPLSKSLDAATAAAPRSLLYSTFVDPASRGAATRPLTLPPGASPATAAALGDPPPEACPAAQAVPTLAQRATKSAAAGAAGNPARGAALSERSPGVPQESWGHTLLAHANRALHLPSAGVAGLQVDRRAAPPASAPGAPDGPLAAPDRCLDHFTKTTMLARACAGRPCHKAYPALGMRMPGDALD